MINFIRKLYSYVNGFYFQLLFFMVLLFIFRPSNNGPVYTAIWQLLLSLIFISGIFNTTDNKTVKSISLVLGSAAVISNFIAIILPLTPLVIIYIALSVLFIAVCSFSVINTVVANANVTMQTLRGVICAYFMIGFFFAFLFLLVEYVSPGSFRLHDVQGQYLLHTRYLAQFMYFSFVTLATIGYGEIVALKDFAQTVTILEGIIGQFYIAIIVARLVAVYSFFCEQRKIDNNKDATTTVND
jgi:voltage-gated potassium channel